MWASWRSTALWLLFAFIVFNITFDRLVAVEGARLTRASVERYLAGERPLTIDEAYRPAVARAALVASLYGAGALALGLVIGRSRIASRRAPRPDATETGR